MAGNQQARTVKLNIGCGPNVVAGWVNIDKSPSVFLARTPRLRRALYAAHMLTDAQASGFPVGVVHADVTRRIPMDDESTDFIYSAHMVEHLSPWACDAFLAECLRVLRHGGVLRLATPDLEQLIDDYKTGLSPFLSREPTAADAFCAEYNAYRDQPGSFVTRTSHKLIGADSHQWLYDQASLARRLATAGLTGVRRCQFQEGTVPDLRKVENRERSLFIEAERPGGASLATEQSCEAARVPQVHSGEANACEF